MINPMSGRSPRAAKIKAANKVLARIAFCFDDVTLSRRHGDIYISWRTDEGRSISRRCCPNEEWLMPPWMIPLSGGGYAGSALSTLIRWCQGRPCYGLSLWRVQWLGDDDWTTGIADEHGPEVSAILAAASYPGESICVKCKRPTRGLLGWRIENTCSGPACDVDHCVKRGIGTIVCGWNEGFKVNSNMGRVNNQKFVQMPLAKLRDRIKQLCDVNGIRFEATEEAYTSKASFLDGDSLPKYGEKPEGWKASGKRVKRGLYQSVDGSRINADLNGAANILRKVASNLGIDLSRVGRRNLTSAARIKLWTSPTVKPLSAESQSL